MHFFHSANGTLVSALGKGLKKNGGDTSAYIEIQSMFEFIILLIAYIYTIFDIGTIMSCINNTVYVLVFAMYALPIYAPFFPSHCFLSTYPSSILTRVWAKKVDNRQKKSKTE